MNRAKKRFDCMNMVKWAGLIFGGIMFLYTKDAFGVKWSAFLAVLAAVGFFTICQHEAQEVMCKYVANDLQDAVLEAGHNHCVVEIKRISTGLVTRIYLINAGRRAVIYERAVIRRIYESWYGSWVWVAQLIDLKDIADVGIAGELLDEELVNGIKRWKTKQGSMELTKEEKKRVFERIAAARAQRLQDEAQGKKPEPAAGGQPKSAQSEDMQPDSAQPENTQQERKSNR